MRMYRRNIGANLPSLLSSTPHRSNDSSSSIQRRPHNQQQQLQKRRWFWHDNLNTRIVLLVVAVGLPLVSIMVGLYYVDRVRPWPFLHSSGSSSTGTSTRRTRVKEYGRGKIRKETIPKINTNDPEVQQYHQKLRQVLSKKNTVSRPKLAALLQHTITMSSDKTKQEEDCFYPGSTIPRIIHQQWKTVEEMTEGMKANVNTFIATNPDSYHMMWEDADIDEFVQLFYSHNNISTIFRTQLPLPIYKSDLFRYMVLQTFGGVYSDIDTVCLKPISSWIPTSSTSPNTTNTATTKVGIIVGVEADAGKRPDWARWYTRQLQWCQWTMASSRNHEILAYVINSIFHKLAEETAESSSKSSRKITTVDDVLYLTGPSAWTDAVNWYITSSLNSHWTKFQNLQGYKRIKDMLALSITGFSPGVGHMGSQGTDHPDAKVEHKFLGSWKIK
jgi:mannosyltransferase OCH1-like enzyme